MSISLTGKPSIAELVGLLPILDWFFSKFERTPEEKRDAELRKLRKKNRKGKFKTEAEYQRQVKEVLDHYAMTASINFLYRSDAPKTLSGNAAMPNLQPLFQAQQQLPTDRLTGLTPVDFRGANVTFSSGDPEVGDLPAFRAEDGQVISAWRLDRDSLVRLIQTPVIYLSQQTSGAPLQPVYLVAENPILFEDPDPSSN